MKNNLTTVEKCEVILQHIIQTCETTGRGVNIGINSIVDRNNMTWDEKVNCLFKIVTDKGIELN